MTITAAEIFTQREGTQDAEWHRTYRRAWTVQTDSPYDGPVAVRAALPVRIGQQYQLLDGSGTQIEYDNGCYCNKISVRCVSADGQQWEATADYEVYNPSVFPLNPLQWPIKISWGTTKFDRVCEYDINENAVLNSADQCFDPPLTCDDSRVNLRVEKQMQYFDPAILLIYKDAINSDTFYGGDPYTWKVMDITAELQYNQDSGTADGFYYTVTFSFEYRPDGWQQEVLDQGLYELDASENLTPILDADGNAVTAPVLLDGAGKKLDLTTGTNKPVFLQFDVYKEQVFANLGLDPTGAPGQGWSRRSSGAADQAAPALPKPAGLRGDLQSDA